MKTVGEINRDIRELKAEGGHADSISDKWHTFGELYFHRAVLFSVILNSNKSISWKSWKHHDGTMFDDSFIVGINTPKGQYTYHYGPELWDLFDVPELEYASEYDGHAPDDVTRLLSLNFPMM